MLKHISGEDVFISLIVNENDDVLKKTFPWFRNIKVPSPLPALAFPSVKGWHDCAGGPVTHSQTNLVHTAYLLVVTMDVPGPGKSTERRLIAVMDTIAKPQTTPSCGAPGFAYRRADGYGFGTGTALHQLYGLASHVVNGVPAMVDWAKDAGVAGLCLHVASKSVLTFFEDADFGFTSLGRAIGFKDAQPRVPNTSRATSSAI